MLGRLSTMDQRYGSRRPTALKVMIRTRHGIAVEGQVREISSSGALVRSTWPANVNGQVLLQFAAPPLNSRSVAVWAEVVRRVEDGFAVEWQDLAPPSLRSLLREVAREARSAYRAAGDHHNPHDRWYPDSRDGESDH